MADRKRCARCGRRFRKGGTYYTLKTELISVFDGHLIEGPGEFDEKLQAIEKKLEGVTEDGMEEQVYKKFEYLVCIACRDEIDKFLRIERTA